MFGDSFGMPDISDGFHAKHQDLPLGNA
jgi:hypothetical protein